MNNRVLVTGSTGKIGGAVATQLLEKGITVRAMVHRDDARSARLRESGAEVVVADMFDIQQVTAAMDGVDRLYFNPPYHPHALDSAVSFAVAARRTGVQAVVALGQWLASPEHPSLMTRHAWLTDKLFELLPDTAHVAVDPGYFADNYLQLVPVAAQLGVLPTPTGTGRNAPSLERRHRPGRRGRAARPAPSRRSRLPPDGPGPAVRSRHRRCGRRCAGPACAPR